MIRMDFGCTGGSGVCEYWFGCSVVDKICMMTTRLACNRAIESSYWGMDNDSDVGLLMGYENWNSWIWIPFPIDSDCTLLCAQVDKTRYIESFGAARSVQKQRKTSSDNDE